MITYNDIYEAARKERYSEQLQPISKNFIKEVAEYLKDKQESASKEDDVFSEVIIKTKKQLENARTYLKEIIRIRRKKILSLVLIAAETGISKQDFNNMLDFEKTLFEELMKCIEISDRVLGESLNGKEEIQKNLLVLFREEVGQFLDMDGKMTGPYSKGQIANIPQEIAKILIDAKKIDVIGDR